MRTRLFILAQATWGFPQALLGGFVFAAHRSRPHFLFHGSIVTTWENAKGMSLGPFIFLKGHGDAPTARDGAPAARGIGELSHAKAAGERYGVDAGLLVHEYGHCVQSLLLGPLYLPLVGLPSLMWANAPTLIQRRQARRLSYYSFAPERNANWLGERTLREPSVGQALVD